MTDHDSLELAEFKQAFDEFDKVRWCRAFNTDFGMGGGTVGHHAPLLSFLTAPLNQLSNLSALYSNLPAMFGDHFPMLILIQGSLV